MRKKQKSLFDIILLSCSVICAFIIGFYVYYHFFVKDKVIGVNYIDNQIPIDIVEKADNLTQEEIDYYEDRMLFNVNYYSNDKNNGIELQEMRLDYFTDYSLEINSCRSTGMQYIGDFETYKHKVGSETEANNRVVEDFYYYDTTNMISWNGGRVATQLNRNAVLIIKLYDSKDNCVKPFSFQLTGNYAKYGRFLFWTFETEHHWYDYGDVFADVMNAVKTNSQGYGDYYVKLDLSEYFTVNEYDKDTGKYVADRTADIIKNYAVLKFHYDENGAVNANQSLFSQIECNRNYGITEVDTTYWQAKTIYNLTNSSLQLRYSDVYHGYIASLSMDNKRILNNSITNITIDLDTTKNIVGIDYNGFENVKIETLTLISSKNENITFYLLDSSLRNTEIETLRKPSNIILNVSETAINNEYTGVTI